MTNITQSATGDISVGAADVTITATTGAITMDAEALTKSTGGNVSYQAGNTITVGSVASSTGDITINSGGNVFNAGDATQDVSGGTVTVNAQQSIDLDTAADQVVLHSAVSGSITIDEIDDLILLDVSTTNGPITITSGSTLRANDVDSSTTDSVTNAITLTATAGNIEAWLIDAGTNGNVTLTALAGSIVQDWQPKTVSGGSLEYPTALLAPGGVNNDFVVRAQQADPTFNGVVVELIGGATRGEARASFEAADGRIIVTIDDESDVDSNLTNANAVIAAISSLPDWAAELDTSETGNDGTGSISLTNSSSWNEAVTSGGTSTNATVTVTPAGFDNDFTVAATLPGPTQNGVEVVFLAGHTAGIATAAFDPTNRVLLVVIDAETSVDALVTTTGSIVNAISTLPDWTATLSNESSGDNSGLGRADILAGDPTVDVLANTLSVSATDRIDLGTQVTDLHAHSTSTGDITIVESDAITLVDLDSADGSITVTAGGDITADDVDTSGTDNDTNDITLATAGGTIAVGVINAGTTNDVALASAGSVIATSDNTLDVVADVLSINAAGPVTLDTEINAIDLTNLSNGNVAIDETDQLTISQITTLGSPITVNANGTINGIDTTSTAVTGSLLTVTSTGGVTLNTRCHNTRHRRLRHRINWHHQQ